MARAHHKWSPVQGHVDTHQAAKGGSSKTTLTEACGAILATHHGLRICLIDMDEQSNLSTRLGIAHSTGRDIEGVLRDGPEPEEPWSVEAALDGRLLSVKLPRIPLRVGFLAGSRLLPYTLESHRKREQDGLLPGFSARLAVVVDHLRSYFDRILIDTPPALYGRPTVMSLLATDTLTCPIVDLDCLDALARLLKMTPSLHVERLKIGRPALPIFLVCPRLVRDDAVPGLSPKDPANASWFPLVDKYLSPFFVTSSVRHSTTLLTVRGSISTYSALSAPIRSDYRNLVTDRLRIERSTANLTELILSGDFPLDEFVRDIEAMSVKSHATDIRRAILQPKPEPKLDASNGSLDAVEPEAFAFEPAALSVP